MLKLPNGTNTGTEQNVELLIFSFYRKQQYGDKSQRTNKRQVRSHVPWTTNSEVVRGRRSFHIKRVKRGGDRLTRYRRNVWGK